MRWALAALLMPLLAACGSSEPPSVDFERPVGSVYNTLASVDGEVDMEGLLKTPVVARKQAANDSLVFVLGADSAENHGQITFRFAKIDDQRTRVLVDAEIPEIKAQIGGSMKFLSEAKIEGLLAERLKAISRQMTKGTVEVAALDELDQAIAFTALALDPEEVKRALELAGDSDALAAAMERELAWSSDDTGDWQAADAVTDTNSGQEAYGDDAAGVEAYGDSAVGSEPEFDSEYGSASE